MFPLSVPSEVNEFYSLTMFNKTIRNVLAAKTIARSSVVDETR